MKLGDIKIGAEYGALDNPKSNLTQTPRQVEVLEVVVEEKRTGYDRYTSTATYRKTKRIKVRVLDANPKKSWGYQLEEAVKGTEIVIDSRQIIAPWKELNKEILAQAAKEQAEAAAEQAVVDRVTAILGKRHANEWGYWHVTTTGRGVELEIADKRVLDKLLTLAEKGAAS